MPEQTTVVFLSKLYFNTDPGLQYLNWLKYNVQNLSWNDGWTIVVAVKDNKSLITKKNQQTHYVTNNYFCISPPTLICNGWNRKNKFTNVESGKLLPMKRLRMWSSCWRFHGLKKFAKNLCLWIITLMELLSFKTLIRSRCNTTCGGIPQISINHHQANRTVFNYLFIFWLKAMLPSKITGCLLFSAISRHFFLV